MRDGWRWRERSKKHWTSIRNIFENILNIHNQPTLKI